MNADTLVQNQKAISVIGLSKKYRIYANARDRLKELLSLNKRICHREFWALNNVTFDVNRAEAVGILGSNGCGKSTLLQIICGILSMTSGVVIKHGRISALLELGAAFNPEFTGRSNVYVNGALMGYSRQEMDALLPSIVEFADIGQFIDQPMKIYSTGMYVRLAFACAVVTRPDILVVDEALSVGDIFFQQKCFRAIRRIIDEGTTCLFVSHDMEAVRFLCDRAVILKSGEVDFIGPAVEAINKYAASLNVKKTHVSTALVTPPESEASSRIGALMTPEDILAHNVLDDISVVDNGGRVVRHGAGGMLFLALRVTNEAGLDTLAVELMRYLDFHVLVRANEAIVDPNVAVTLFDRLGNFVFAGGARQVGHRLPDMSAGDSLVVRLRLTFTVKPGYYTFGIGASEPSESGVCHHDRLDGLGPVIVTFDETNELPFHGMTMMPLEVGHRGQRHFQHGSAPMPEMNPTVLSL
ncbi:MAG: ABC transporter ATP-binding protein [Nitrospirae bacterium]|uniref:ABC transporter ATP-binding protein n=1 Tax=Candidatus Magnetobacterium casense TaxID=1455061 RepID=UPI000697F56B|nr:ABC transporter ATP-binding protein [Candidatus Magnetobacterium casensis]MBF0336713.1 ABC transporter ATP-binding protein [Nitrospirota bacterium]